MTVVAFNGPIIRYLGVYIRQARHFSCSFDHAKRSFYRNFNAVYGQIGRVASENVILYLLETKCLPSMLYALEACPVNITENRSFDFVLTRVLMKIFKTKSEDVVNYCMFYFCFSISVI